MIKLKEYLIQKETLAQNLGLEKEAIKTILCNLFYLDYTDFINNYNSLIDENKYDKYINEYLFCNKPAQYIVGFTYFCECKINVNSDVLIPRPETEILVEKAFDILKSIKNSNDLKIVDIGTGSGAIAIAIAKKLQNDVFFPNINKMTNIEVFATDISIKALEIAKNNAIINNVDINFYLNDLLYDFKEKNFDMIISNPPYIDECDISDVEDIVLKNEPHLALFAQDKGLFYYKKILEQSKEYLKENGTIVFEIGYKQKNSIFCYAKTIYPNCVVTTIKDYNNLDRILIIKLK